MDIKKNYSASDSLTISEDHPVKRTQQMLIARNEKKLFTSMFQIPAS